MTEGGRSLGDTERKEALLDLREEIEEAADEAREKADEMNLEQAAASQHGMADAYESVMHRIDTRLYGGDS